MSRSGGPHAYIYSLTFHRAICFHVKVGLPKWTKLGAKQVHDAEKDLERSYEWAFFQKNIQPS